MTAWLEAAAILVPYGCLLAYLVERFSYARRHPPDPLRGGDMTDR